MLHTGFFTSIAVLSPAAVVPDPWTPDELGSSIVAGWFDASDAGTITLNGSTISAWNDKSGNARHIAQGSAPLQPTYTASGLNSLNIATFDGGDGIAGAASGMTDNSPGSTILAVMNNSNDLQSAHVALGAAGFGLAIGLSVAGAATRVSGSDPVANTAFFSTTEAVWQLVSGTITTALREIFLNGASQDTDSTGQGAVTSDSIYLGFGPFAGGPFTGMLAEVIFLAGTDTDDRQLCEGYLAWKWGLQGSLDAGHPYKSAAPTV